MLNNICAEIARLGLTKTEFAKLIGISRSTLRNWIRGGDIPSTKLTQLSEIFSCDVDYLLKKYEPKNLNKTA